MRCPRCDSPVDDDAVRCPACRAPLQFLEEPVPSRLDVDLKLDRRSRSATVSAPASDARDERDLGDLSFDPPADDSAWTFGEPAAGDPEPEQDEREPAAVDAVEESAAAWEDITPPGDPAPEPALVVAGLEPESLDGDVGDAPPDPDLDQLPAPGDVPAVRRGRLLSVASIALAAAVAVVAVLTSR